MWISTCKRWEHCLWSCIYVYQQISLQMELVPLNSVQLLKKPQTTHIEWSGAVHMSKVIHRCKHMQSFSSSFNEIKTILNSYTKKPHTASIQSARKPAFTFHPGSKSTLSISISKTALYRLGGPCKTALLEMLRNLPVGCQWTLHSLKKNRYHSKTQNVKLVKWKLELWLNCWSVIVYNLYLAFAKKSLFDDTIKLEAALTLP